MMNRAPLAMVAVMLATAPLPLAAAPAPAPALPLPAKTDIPADFSTVLCASNGAAVKMLDYYVVSQNGGWTNDIDTFFRGIKATGCRQDDPQRDKPITIKTVLARKTLKLNDGNKVVTAYSGTDGNGKAVIGVVDETWNDRVPRTALEKWLHPRTSDGKTFEVSTEEGGRHGYACPSTAAARAAVVAIPQKLSDARKQQAFSAALKKQKCVQTSGKFRPVAVFEDRIIGCGLECDYQWTALEVVDARGRRLGVIYDASIM